MAKYLKKFETQSAYNAAESSLILPNVSLIKETNSIGYKPYVDPYGGHEYVEIGGLKWATMNIGANSVTNTGLYFQWGDTQGYTAAQVGSGEGQKYFGWEDYKYCNGSSSPGYADITKYNTSDIKMTLDASDDAAKAAWGGKWRMPTTYEYQALSATTTSAWTNSYQGSGIAGLVLTSKADSSVKLFFPALGECFDGSVDDEGIGEHCRYWSSSRYSSDCRLGRYMAARNGSVSWTNSHNRCRGYQVRGVAD